MREESSLSLTEAWLYKKKDLVQVLIQIYHRIGTNLSSLAYTESEDWYKTRRKFFHPLFKVRLSLRREGDSVSLQISIQKTKEPLLWERKKTTCLWA